VSENEKQHIPFKVVPLYDKFRYIFHRVLQEEVIPVTKRLLLTVVESYSINRIAECELF
jgi:hypothetical protein